MYTMVTYIPPLNSDSSLSIDTHRPRRRGVISLSSQNDGNSVRVFSILLRRLWSSAVCATASLLIMLSVIDNYHRVQKIQLAPKT